MAHLMNWCYPPSIDVPVARAGASHHDSAKSKGFIGYELSDIVKQSNLAQDVTLQTLETLLKEGRVRRIGIWWFAQSVWEALVEETIRLLSEQHRQYPLRSGLSKEEWRTRLNLSPKMAADIFAALQADRCSGRYRDSLRRFYPSP